MTTFFYYFYRTIERNEFWRVKKVNELTKGRLPTRGKILKYLRVFLSLLFFLLTLLLFIDFASVLSLNFIHTLLYFQFIPSIVASLAMFTMATTGFLLILIITFLYGRIYCSTVCPLGTLQDLCIGVATRVNNQTRNQYQAPNPIFSYVILGITVLLFLFGNMMFITLTDPFSLTGKIFSNLIRPICFLEYQVLSATGSIFDLPGIAIYSYPIFSWPAIFFSGSVLLIIVLLSVYKNRWFCNSLCPVGTLLGLISRVSLFKIQIENANCLGCGQCYSVCKTGCIDFNNQELDFSRCVVCFNCMARCPNGGIHFGLRHKKPKPSQIRGIREIPSPRDNSRRKFLKTTALLGLFFTNQNIYFPNNLIRLSEAKRPDPALPPGSQSYWHYRERCISCHLCVSNCPTHVLQPGFLSFGLSGFFQPVMDYQSNFCQYDCVRCSEICPSGAIQRITVDQKHRIQTGIAKLIRNLCVVAEKKQACGICLEQCPVEAITMVSYLGDLKIPEIEEKRCIGCGACEYFCPTRPTRAIYVESLSYHRMLPQL